MEVALPFTPLSPLVVSTATTRRSRSPPSIGRAIEVVINFLDTADMYGPLTNEKLVGKAI
jgi:aryl-alcohol dehydrogenase-like predicted oxidoreductase